VKNWKPYARNQGFYDIAEFYGKGRFNKKDKPRTGIIRYKLADKRYSYNKLRIKIYSFKSYKDIANAYKRDRRLCEDCKKVLCTQVHHVDNVYSKDDKFGYFDLDKLHNENNFVALCAGCHRIRPRQSMKKKLTRCGQCESKLNEDGTCDWCTSRSQLSTEKKKPGENNVLRRAILAAEEIINKAYTLEITKLCLMDFIRKATKHVQSEKIHVLDEILEIVESYPLPTGNRAEDGSLVKLKLLPFQLISFIQVFGSFADLPFKKQVFMTCARKNGKTALSAAFLLTFAEITKNFGVDIYTAATTEKQATLSLKYAKSMLELKGGEINRRGEFKSSDGKWKVKSESIEFVPKRVTVRALTANPKSLDGLSPQFLLCDESALMDDECFKVLNTSASKALSNQCFFYISTLSHNETGYYKSTIDNTRARLKEGRDTTIEMSAFCLEKDEREVEDVEAWHATNPALGITLDVAEMKNELEQAKDAGMTNTFLLKRMNMSGIKELNQICDVKDALATRELNKLIVLKKLKEHECVVGFDISMRGSFTTLCVATRDDEGSIFADFQYFTCKDSFKKRTERSADNIFSEFRDRGELKIVGDKKIDFEQIIPFLKSIDKTFTIVACYSDVATGGLSIYDEVERAEVSFHVEEIKLRPQDRHFTSNMVVEAVTARKLHTTDCLLFAWELRNAAHRELTNIRSEDGELPDGSFEIVRSSPNDYKCTIDGVMALCHALLYFRESDTIGIKDRSFKEIADAVSKVYGN